MSGALNGKRILIGVSGGIAIYKTLSLLSQLNKAGAMTEVVMTQGAKQFIQPMTFETMSKNRVYDDTFTLDHGEIPHIVLGRRNEVMMIAPASADVIAKLAHGIADDLLTAAVLAATCPVIICPAMNVVMYQNPATQANLDILRKRNFRIVEPGSGWLACNEVGDGRMPEAEELFDVLDSFFTEQDLQGRKILVTAGPTRERIDPVRFITNDSSGRQGVAIARRAAKRGAEVLLIHGPLQVEVPKGVKAERINSTEELHQAVKRALPSFDALVMAAAPSDYAPLRCADHKIKKDSGESLATLELKENADILADVGKDKGERVLIGFAAETHDLLENAVKKLKRKNLDYIICNDVSRPGVGFDGETNAVTILSAGGAVEVPMMSKEEIADRILDLLK